MKNHLPYFDEFWCISWCFFVFTQFWLDGRPGNEYFWNSQKIFDHLTPLTYLGLHPQWFEIDWSNSSQSAIIACPHLCSSMEQSQQRKKNQSYTVNILGQSALYCHCCFCWKQFMGHLAEYVPRTVHSISAKSRQMYQNYKRGANVLQFNLYSVFQPKSLYISRAVGYLYSRERQLNMFLCLFRIHYYIFFK